MNGQKYRRRPAVVDVQRFQNGIFTKGEWLEWCPQANIGTSGATWADSLAARTFEWFDFPSSEHNGGGGSVNVLEGDYVIKHPDGSFSCLDAVSFTVEFERAYG